MSGTRICPAARTDPATLYWDDLWACHMYRPLLAEGRQGFERNVSMTNRSAYAERIAVLKFSQPIAKRSERRRGFEGTKQGAYRNRTLHAGPERGTGKT
jgi:hypothetical protein